MTVGLAGSGAPLADGELVVLLDRRGRRYLVTLRAGGEWHSHAGTLAHDDLVGAVEGTARRTSKGMEVLALRPTREDMILKMPRGAQVVYPKDQAMILAEADIRPGCVVIEAGTGSGALTMALWDAVGAAGRVISIEHREDHARVARANLEQWLGELPGNLELVAGDVTELMTSLRAHRVVLDLVHPWTCVDAAAAALAPGGLLLAYTPTIPQVMRFQEALATHGSWAAPRTIETLVRPWEVDGLSVRPAHRMVAHTAFLTTARRVPSPDEGGPTRRPSRTSGIGWTDPNTATEAPTDPPKP